MTLQDQVIRKHLWIRYKVHTNYQFNFSCLLGNKNALQCICGNTWNGLTYLYPESCVCVCVCFQQENYLNNMYIMSENYLSIFFGERSVWVSQMMIKLAKCTLASMWLETNDTKISQDHLLADVKKQFNKNQHYLFFLNPPHMVYIFKRLLYTHIFTSFLCGK